MSRTPLGLVTDAVVSIDVTWKNFLQARIAEGQFLVKYATVQCAIKQIELCFLHCEIAFVKPFSDAEGSQLTDAIALLEKKLPPKGCTLLKILFDGTERQQIVNALQLICLKPQKPEILDFVQRYRMVSSPRFMAYIIPPIPPVHTPCLPVTKVGDNPVDLRRNVADSQHPVNLGINVVDYNGSYPHLNANTMWSATTVLPPQQPFLNGNTVLLVYRRNGLSS